MQSEMAFCSNCGSADQDAKFCTVCGERPGEEKPSADRIVSPPKKNKTKKSEAAKARKSSQTCPECDSSGAVQRVASVIDGGNTSTQGTALSIPINGGQWTTTSFASASTTSLANRLAPYSIPVARMWPWVLALIGLAAWFVGKWATENFAAFKNFHYFGSGNGELLISIVAFVIVAAFALIPGLLFGLLMRAIGNATWLAEARANWHPCASRVYNAYYCFRDDTMFDGDAHGRPEDFINEAFS